MRQAHSLLSAPLWQTADLGLPIPPEAGEHAVSVCLPRWADVIGYEEAEERVLSALQAGYPRFCLTKSVLELGKQILPEARLALPYPKKVAHQIFEQLRQAGIACDKKAWHEANSYGELEILGVFDDAGERQLRKLWRYFGEGISSRCAEALLKEQGGTQVNSDKQLAAKNSRQALRSLLAEFYQIPTSHLWLFPSGMAANAACLRALEQVRGERASIQFGFPYVDCLRLQGEFAGVDFARASDFASLEEQFLFASDNQSLKAANYLALFCEAVTNPLIEHLPLSRIAQSCQAAKLPLVIDDSVPSVGLIPSLAYADILTSSLTKWMNGHADVMGGLVAISPQSPWAKSLCPLLEEASQAAPLASEDALVLLARAQKFPARIQQAACHAYQVGKWLEAQPKVAQLWWSHSQENFPHWQEFAASAQLAQEAAVPLISFQLQSEVKAAAFYDALVLSKGPSFGTEWSLLCPYTLLAHYDELDWCAQQGVPRDLLRLSVGLEPPEEIISRLAIALEAV